ncbi:MAG: hypothetical protein ABUL44_04230, partial [Flavobacterium sp.]
LAYFDAAAMVYSGFDHPNRDFTPQQLTDFNNAKANLLSRIQQHEANGPMAGSVTDYNLHFSNSMFRSSGFPNVGTRFPANGCQ